MENGLFVRYSSKLDCEFGITLEEDSTKIILRKRLLKFPILSNYNDV